jgi:hypothetical protein
MQLTTEEQSQLFEIAGYIIKGSKHFLKTEEHYLEPGDEDPTCPGGACAQGVLYLEAGLPVDAPIKEMLTDVHLIDTKEYDEDEDDECRDADLNYAWHIAEGLMTERLEEKFPLLRNYRVSLGFPDPSGNNYPILAGLIIWLNDHTDYTLFGIGDYLWSLAEEATILEEVHA